MRDRLRKPLNLTAEESAVWDQIVGPHLVAADRHLVREAVRAILESDRIEVDLQVIDVTDARYLPLLRRASAASRKLQMLSRRRLGLTFGDRQSKPRN